MRIDIKTANTVKDALYGSVDSTIKTAQLYDAVRNDGDRYDIGIGAAALANSVAGSFGKSNPYISGFISVESLSNNIANASNQLGDNNYITHETVLAIESDLASLAATGAFLAAGAFAAPGAVAAALGFGVLLTTTSMVLAVGSVIAGDEAPVGFQESIANTIEDALALKDAIAESLGSTYDDFMEIVDELMADDVSFDFGQLISEWVDLYSKLKAYNPDSSLNWNEWEFDINQPVNTNYESAINFVPTPPRRRDPLTLDLNDNGIQTIGADGSVLFDHDADGIKEGTGWIAPEDGLLVFDRNGNGTIDSGRELFGDNTIKSDGTLAQTRGQVSHFSYKKHELCLDVSELTR